VSEAPANSEILRRAARQLRLSAITHLGIEDVDDEFHDYWAKRETALADWLAAEAETATFLEEDGGTCECESCVHSVLVAKAILGAS
jgi:hypothetical protein